jgi:hypothetical protein
MPRQPQRFRRAPAGANVKPHNREDCESRRGNVLLARGLNRFDNWFEKDMDDFANEQSGLAGYATSMITRGTLEDAIESEHQWKDGKSGLGRREDPVAKSNHAENGSKDSESRRGELVSLKKFTLGTSEGCELIHCG